MMREPDTRRVGKYEIVKLLAQGGMAEIFLARQAGIGGFSRRVVLKRILPALAEERRFVDMFLEEARLASLIHHPNVVQIFDVFEDGGDFYIAMEYVDGLSVATILEQCRKERCALPHPIASEIIAQACSGLHAAHELRGDDERPLGLVHRDVSPQNLMVTKDGVVKLLDFGIAKAVDSGATTRTGNIKGKYAYMSPEQVRGEALDRRSDLFALGALFHELLIGQRLFDRSAELAILVAIVEDEIKGPHELDPTVPGELSDLILHALERDRERRFQDAAQLRSAVRTVLGVLGVQSSPEDLASYLRDRCGEKLEAMREAVRKAEVTPTSARRALGAPPAEPWVEAAPEVGLVGMPELDDEDDEPTVPLTNLDEVESDLAAPQRETQPDRLRPRPGSPAGDRDEVSARAWALAPTQPFAPVDEDEGRGPVLPEDLGEARALESLPDGAERRPAARAASRAELDEGAGYRRPVFVARRGRAEDVVELPELGPEPGAEDSQRVERISAEGLAALAAHPEPLAPDARASSAPAEAASPAEPACGAPPEHDEADPEAVRPTAPPAGRAPVPGRRRPPRPLVLAAVLIVLLAGGAAALHSFGPHSAAPQGPPLLYAVPSSFPMEANEAGFGPLADYLGAALDGPVRLVTHRDYRSMRSGLESGAVQLANMPPLLLVESLSSGSRIQPLVSATYEGSASYQSYIVSSQGSGVDAVERLAGKTFCYPDRDSTSGYLLPRQFLRSRGIDPDRFFGSTRVSGSHVEVMRDLVAGKCDGGAIFSGAWLGARALGVKSEQIHMIAVAGETTRDVVCASPDLPADVVAKLRKAFLDFEPRKTLGREVLSDLFPIDGFVEARLEDLEPVERAARAEKLID